MERHLHQQEDPLVAFDREKQNKKNTLYIGFIYRHFPPFLFPLFSATLKLNLISNYVNNQIKMIHIDVLLARAI